MGKSQRNIESETQNTIFNHGLNSWNIIKFFGLGDSDKGRFNELEFQNIIS